MAATTRAVLPVVLFLLALAAAPLFAWGSEPTFPALTGRVIDSANLLSAGTEQALTADLQALEEKTTDQLVVVTLPTLQGYEIEEFGYRLGRHWGIGQVGKDNGVLLIVAPNERKVRIEVGRGLEGTLPDAMANLIIEKAILPHFRYLDFPGGIATGVRDITTILAGDAEVVRRRLDPPVGHYIAQAIVGIFALAVWLLIIGFVLGIIKAITRRGVKKGKGNKSSGWTFGSGSSSGSGGGGFSGGGGGFGGGGASGGW